MWNDVVGEGVSLAISQTYSMIIIFSIWHKQLLQNLIFTAKLTEF